MAVSNEFIPAGGAALCSTVSAIVGHGLWAAVIGGVIGAAVSVLCLVVASRLRMAERQQLNGFAPDVRADVIELERAQRAPVVRRTQ